MGFALLIKFGWGTAVSSIYLSSILLVFAFYFFWLWRADRQANYLGWFAAFLFSWFLLECYELALSVVLGDAVLGKSIGTWRIVWVVWLIWGTISAAILLRCAVALNFSGTEVERRWLVVTLVAVLVAP